MSVTARSGLPPKSRARLLNATVRADWPAAPANLELNKANDWSATVELSLGATPLRGAVWISPRCPPTCTIRMDPPRVVLYEAGTTVEPKAQT